MVHVPYKGAGPAITDLIGGRLDFMITTLPSVVGFIKSGKAKPLAVTMQERSERLPEVPTDRRERLPRLPGRGLVRLRGPEGHAARDRDQAARRHRRRHPRPGRADAASTSRVRVVIGNTPEEFGSLHAGRVQALGRADPDGRADHGLSIEHSAEVRRPG